MSKHYFFMLALLVGAVMTTLFVITLARGPYVAAHPRFRLRHFRTFLRGALVTGTDANLKVEFAFLLVLSIVIWLSPEPSSLGPQWPPLVALAALVGFTLRQWLSRWRLRNIVGLDILFTDRLFYFKSLANRSYLVLALVLCIYLSALNPSLAAASFVGFVAHEVWLESKKGRRLLTRKLHLFDIDETPLSPRTHELLLEALSRLDFRAVERLARNASDPNERLLISTFSSLLRDDFEGFRALLTQNEPLISSNSALVSYFGRALYIIGDVEAARSLLSRLSTADRGPLCAAYEALASLADPADKASAAMALSLLDATSGQVLPPKAAMLSNAFRALALAITHSRERSTDPSSLDLALLSIHSALRTNDALLRNHHLGKITKDYFDANHQMFLDIYGYVLFRSGNLTLSFRVLQAAISADDTYPWPYFHLALIYQRVGRLDIARALLLRIALNERSDTVLKRLCLRRLESIEVLPNQAPPS